MSLSTSAGSGVPLTPDDALRLISDPDTPLDLYAEALGALLAGAALKTESRNHFLGLIANDPRAFAPESVRVILPWLVSVRRVLHEPVRWLAHARLEQGPVQWLANARLSDEQLMIAEGILAQDAYERANTWLDQLAGAICRLTSGDEEAAVIRYLASVERITQEFVNAQSYAEHALVSVLIGLRPVKSWRVFQTLLAPRFRAQLAYLYQSPNREYGKAGEATIAEYVTDRECLVGDRAEQVMAVKVPEVDELLVLNPAMREEDLWRMLIRYLKAGKPDQLGNVAAGRAELLQFLITTGQTEAVARALVHAERIPESIRPSVALEAMVFLKAQKPGKYYNYTVRKIAGEVYRILGDSAGEVLVKLRNDEIVEGLIDAWKGDDDRTLRALMQFPRKNIRASMIPTEIGIKSMDAKKKAMLLDVVLPALAKDRVVAIQTAASDAMLRLSPESASVLAVFRSGESPAIIETLKTFDRLPEGWLDVLLARVRARSFPGVWPLVLETAVRREGLTLEQLQAIASLREDALTQEVVKHCAEAFPEAKEFLESLMDHGELTRGALAALQMWDVEERSVFLNSQELHVRQSLAASSVTLTRPEIIALLSDSDRSVRSALVQNRAWKKYVMLI